MLNITAIVLTKNEERNLRGCLESIKNHVDQIIIVDSFSEDSTVQIAQEYTDSIFQNKFTNHANQFSYAVSLPEIRNDWILRIDADERWTDKGFLDLQEIISLEEVRGVYVTMLIYFMGKPLRFGGMSGNLFLRVFNRKYGKIENRWMDEHIIVDGPTIKSNISVFEKNYDRQQNIGLWIIKHNNYSLREAVDYLIKSQAESQIDTIANLFGSSVERKRWLKERVYNQTPRLLRVFIYFLYRYVALLGFLDGKSGFLYHLLHGFWYRLLVDLKINEIQKKLKHNSLKVVLKEEYQIEL